MFRRCRAALAAGAITGLVSLQRAQSRAAHSTPDSPDTGDVALAGSH